MDILKKADQIIELRKSLIVMELDPLTEEELWDMFEREYCIFAVAYSKGVEWKKRYSPDYNGALKVFKEIVKPLVYKAR